MLSIVKADGRAVPPEPGSIWRGIAFAGVINICALLGGIATIFVYIGIFIVGGFGVVQVAWILPLYHKYQSREETESAKGVLIAAGITFLLSAGCWGYVIIPHG